MLDVSDLAPGERTLRPFDIACKSADGEFDVKLDLPVSWAKHHESVVVAFHDAGRPLGWHAWLVGEDGDLLLSFPWHDHADTALGGPRPFQPGTWFRQVDDFPVELTEKGWDELEQSWWGHIIPDGDLSTLPRPTSTPSPKSRRGASRARNRDGSSSATS